MLELDSKILNELKNLSEKISSDIYLNQGPGGNLSYKDQGTMWIKSSGTWLKDAIYRNIFIPVKIKNIKDELSFELFDEEDFSYKNSKPSIETKLHLCFKEKFVLHTHSLNTLSHAVREKGETEVKKKLKKYNAAWIPYIQPGENLALKVKEIINDKTNVVILANHGLLISGDKGSEVFEILLDIENKLALEVKNIKVRDQYSENSIKEYYPFRKSKFLCVDKIAFSKFSTKSISKANLFPDQVIFLPAQKIFVCEEIFFHKNEKFISSQYEVVVIRDKAVLVSKDISETSELILFSLSIVLQNNENKKLSFISCLESETLSKWDSEKHRKKIAK